MVEGAGRKAKRMVPAVYQWCGFKSRRGKNKNLTALKSNSNTVWFNFQTYIIFSINLVSLITLRSSGTDILYGCHLLLDVCIYIYIRLKIKPNGVRIRFLSCQIFVLPSTGFELTPLMHCNTIRLALRPAP